MQNEEDTNVPTGDELFEQPTEFANEDDDVQADEIEKKANSGTDAQRKRRVPIDKRSGGTDAQRRHG